MPTITWQEGEPQDGEAYSGFPGRTRSLKSNLAYGLKEVMQWPGTGGGSLASAGELKPGSFRALMGTESSYSVPSVNTPGDLFLSSNSSMLMSHGVPSASTMRLGGVRLVEHVTFPGQTRRWVFSSGTLESGGGVSFGVVYDAPPRVQVSIFSNLDSLDTFAIALPTNVTVGGFTPAVLNEGGTGSGVGVILHWLSHGTVTF